MQKQFLPGPAARARAAAWAVHLFTASGAVAGLAALLAVFDGNARLCWWWLGVALLIDGIDGTLARRARVRAVLPQVDGAVLDLVIDYLTYVVVPTLFLLRAGLLPAGLAGLLSAYVLVSSLYCFSNVQMKSADNYFVGFPAVWNLVAFYLWVLQWPAAANAAVVVMLGILTPTPIKFLHPFRAGRLLPATLLVAVVWSAASIGLTLAYPAQPPVALALWLLATAYYAGVCAWRTLHGPLDRPAP